MEKEEEGEEEEEEEASVVFMTESQKSYYHMSHFVHWKWSHTQGRKNEFPPLIGRSIKEFMYII